MSSFSAQDDGLIVGLFNNGVQRDLGQLALARFPAFPPTLQYITGSLFSETRQSGQAVVGLPRRGIFGEIRSGILESPNMVPAPGIPPTNTNPDYFSADGLGDDLTYTHRPTSGPIEFTGVPTDVAINGAGFFVVENDDGERFYTRDGHFRINAAGQLVTSNGFCVLGRERGDLIRGDLRPIQIPLGNMMTTQATTQVVLEGRLSPTAALGQLAAADFVAYDSLGLAVPIRLTAILAARDAVSTTYEWHADLRNADDALDGDSRIGAGEIIFNHSGVVAMTSGMAVTIDRSHIGAAPLEFVIDADNLSGLAADTLMLGVAGQDGAGPGMLTAFKTKDNGTVEGIFTNGVRRSLAVIQLAHFGFSPLLEPVGHGMFDAGQHSGTPAIAPPGRRGLGTLVDSALERLDAAPEATCDLMVDGTGFFVVEDSNGRKFFTKQGKFYTVNSGQGSELVVAGGQRLLGSNVDATVDRRGKLEPIVFQIGTAGAGHPTTTVTLAGILSPLATPREAPLGDGAQKTSFHTGHLLAETELAFYSARGYSSRVLIGFAKEPYSPDDPGIAYRWFAFLPDLQGAPILDNTATTGLIHFDENGHVLADDRVASVTLDIGPFPRSMLVEFALDFSPLYCLATDQSTSNVSYQDGKAPGNLDGFSVSSRGVVTGLFDNAESRGLSQIHLAHFANPRGLRPVGNGLYTATWMSGPPVEGIPGQGRLGLIKPTEEPTDDAHGDRERRTTHRRGRQPVRPFFLGSQRFALDLLMRDEGRRDTETATLTTRQWIEELDLTLSEKPTLSQKAVSQKDTIAGVVDKLLLTQY